MDILCCNIWQIVQKVKRNVLNSVLIINFVQNNVLCHVRLHLHIPWQVRVNRQAEARTAKPA